MVSIMVSIMVSSVPAYGWDFGFFEQGDVFVYDVCDDTTVNPALSRTHECYVLEFLIIDAAQASFGPVWITQVVMDGPDGMLSDVVLIDNSFNIYPYSERYIAESLSNTIFWMNHHAKIYSFDPQLGKSIPHTSPVFDDSAFVIDDYQFHDDYVKYQFSFDSDSTRGSVSIRDDVYLPIQGAVFNIGLKDTQIFSFELKSFVRASSSFWSDTTASDGVSDGEFYDDSNVFFSNDTAYSEIPLVPDDVNRQDVDNHTTNNDVVVDDLIDIVVPINASSLTAVDSIDIVPDDIVPDDIVPDDIVPDDIVPDDIIPDDIIPDDIIPDETVEKSEIPDKPQQFDLSGFFNDLFVGITEFIRT